MEIPIIVPFRNRRYINILIDKIKVSTPAIETRNSSR